MRWDRFNRCLVGCTQMRTGSTEIGKLNWKTKKNTFRCRRWNQIKAACIWLLRIQKLSIHKSKPKKYKFDMRLSPGHRVGIGRLPERSSTESRTRCQQSQLIHPPHQLKPVNPGRRIFCRNRKNQRLFVAIKLPSIEDEAEISSMLWKKMVSLIRRDILCCFCCLGAMASMEQKRMHGYWKLRTQMNIWPIDKLNSYVKPDCRFIHVRD